MPRGGYRKPTNPAAVSGPGSLSRRTDGGPTQAAKYISGGAYGEGKAMLDMQRQAPMAGNSAAQVQPQSDAPALPPKPVLGINDLSERPDEPVTHGVDFGPGAGSEVMDTPKPASLYDTLNKIAPFDPTGDVEFLLSTIIQKGM